MMTLALAHTLLPGSRLVGDGATSVLRVHSDTRSLRPGDLFVALRGEHFDAHDFLAQAKASGAVAALAERGLAEAVLPGLEVADTRTALGTLAAGWRRGIDLPLIAVTGSNGKTTVTQMIAAILRACQGDGALSTEGNFNNDIGVPLTLLRLRPERHRVAVVELGMNHPGEIAQLAAMAAPTVALVNNAQREHQEFMASVEAVARENGSVIAALVADGVAVFPADDVHTPLWRALAGTRRVITFALGAEDAADVTGQARWSGDHWTLALHTPIGDATLVLRIAGQHNVRNALAATACALAVGCPLAAIVRGLEAFTAVKGRSHASSFERGGQRVTVVDDSYNANPDSVRAAIEVLTALPAPRWLVLGDMGEVGDQGAAFHLEVGAFAQRAGIESLWTAGPLCAHAAAAYGAAARHFESTEALLSALPEAPAGASVLVKGSRFMKMERVVAALKPVPSAASAAPTGAAHAA
jgi:UDP-N-acetylmuramoyl-tripeptide--D-alanyl-D-alanine ligase